MHRSNLPLYLKIKILRFLKDPRVWLVVLSLSLIGIGCAGEILSQTQQAPLLMP